MSCQEAPHKPNRRPNVWAIWAITLFCILLSAVNAWAKPMQGPLRWTIPTFTPTPTPHTGIICVSVYHDRNRDGIRQPASEELLPEAEVHLANISGSVITKGITTSEGPYCFRGLAAGTYMVFEKDPPGYQSTTDNTWGAIVLANTMISIPFGDVLADFSHSVALPLILRSFERSK